MLEEAKAGDRIIVASYGDGADALLFKATGKAAPQHSTVKEMLANKLMITSYSRFLSYKGILEAQPGEPFRLMPSASVTWREQELSFGSMAANARTAARWPTRFRGYATSAIRKINYEEVRIAEMKGKVFTFSRDYLAGRSDDPIICQTVVEMDNGMRFYGLMTDCDPGKVELGMPVELMFRRIYEGAGFHNYYWKVRPSRKGE